MRSLDDFNKSPKNKDGHHSYCRACQSAHYYANARRHGENVRRTSAARMRRIRQIVVEALSGGCVDCGNKDIRVLEFDHVRGPKVGNVSSIIRRGWSEKIIVAEIAKCEVRCRNCHAIATLSRLARTWHDAYLDGPPGGI